MTQPLSPVNTIAPLKNVAMCGMAMERATSRAQHLPGMVAFYGPSGWGKTFAATFVANKYRAYYVEAKSTWTKKALLLGILTEMGIAPAKTIYEMADQVAEQLVLSQRPLIIDEMDHLVERSAVEIVRDIYEASAAPILLIGEELFPAKLRRWERFHNRILVWQQAHPADHDDAAYLARLYAPEVEVADDLLRKIVDVTRGATRRVCVNIEQVRQLAVTQGWAKIDAKLWGARELYTGDAPARRIA